MVLTVKFLPGVPDKFQRSFKIQVAHFEPEDISIFCEGIFPRITLDLPRYDDPEGKALKTTSHVALLILLCSTDINMNISNQRHVAIK
mgnify:CR=1 FL=1